VRVLDRHGVEVTPDEDGWSLSESEAYRLVFADGMTVRGCRLGPRLLTRDEDGGFALRAAHSVGLDELVVDLDGARLRRVIEWVPNGQKLDADAWSTLVRDLSGWLPGVLAGISASGGGSAVVERGVPAGIVAAAVTPLVPSLLRAIEAVVRNPRVLERSLPDDRRMHTVRRVRPETVRWLARHPEAFAAVEGAEFSGDPWVPSRVSDVTLDHPANRAVRWYAERVAALLTKVGEALQRAARGEFDDSAHWCTAQSAVMAAHASRLHALVARSFLSTLPAAPPTASALLTLADEPVYARVLRRARAILAATFSDARGEGEPVPVRASFELYELWSLLQLRRSFDAVLGEGDWRTAGRTDHALLAHALHGFTMRRVLDEGTLTLGYNLTFRSHLVAPDNDRVALTGERRPDLVVSWSPREGDPSWVVLDAKYRVAVESVREAFPSLHVYRDALRWRSQGGAPRRGLLLVPDVADTCAPWASAEFVAAHGFGLWRMRPGVAGDEALGRWLCDALGLRLGLA
jgi:hypothetical protein